jgi:hypothetical protein
MQDRILVHAKSLNTSTCLIEFFGDQLKKDSDIMEGVLPLDFAHCRLTRIENGLLAESLDLCDKLISKKT